PISIGVGGLHTENHVIGGSEQAGGNARHQQDGGSGHQNAQRARTPTRRHGRTVSGPNGITQAGSERAAPDRPGGASGPRPLPQQQARRLFQRARCSEGEQQENSAVYLERQAQENAARPDGGYGQHAPRHGRRGAREQNAAAGHGQQETEGGIGVEVPAQFAAAVEHQEGHQVAGRRAHQREQRQSGRYAGVVAGELQSAADADEECQRALRGLEPGEGEAAQQGAHDGAGEINAEQRHLRAEQGRMRDRRIAFRQPMLEGHQPGGEQHRQIGGGGGQPALAQPVIQAGGDFHGQGDGQKHEREGQDIQGRPQEGGDGTESGQRGEGGHDQQVLAPGYREAEQGKRQQESPRRPGGDGVQ